MVFVSSIPPIKKDVKGMIPRGLDKLKGKRVAIIGTGATAVQVRSKM